MKKYHYEASPKHCQKAVLCGMITFFFLNTSTRPPPNTARKQCCVARRRPRQRRASVVCYFFYFILFPVKRCMLSKIYLIYLFISEPQWFVTFFILFLFPVKRCMLSKTYLIYLFLSAYISVCVYSVKPTLLLTTKPQPKP